MGETMKDFFAAIALPVVTFAVSGLAWFGVERLVAWLGLPGWPAELVGAFAFVAVGAGLIIAVGFLAARSSAAVFPNEDSH
jgi:hypothetical protein